VSRSSVLGMTGRSQDAGGVYLTQAGPALRGPGFAQAFERFQQSMGFDRIPEPVRSEVLAGQEVRQDLVLGYWDEVMRFEPERLQERVEQVAAAIDVPVLAVFGQPLSSDERDFFRRLVPGVQLEEWPGRGHLVHLAEADRFAARLRAFVDFCEARRSSPAADRPGRTRSQLRPLVKPSWADAVGRARADVSAPGRPATQAPTRAAADEPEQDEGDPRRRRGQHKHRHHGDHSDSNDHRNQQPGTEHSGPRNRIGSPTRARQAHSAIGWEVYEQLRKVAVASGTQRPLYPLLKLVRLQPAFAGRLAQPVDDRLAIGIRRPQRVVASHRLPRTVPRTGQPRGSTGDVSQPFHWRLRPRTFASASSRGKPSIHRAAVRVPWILEFEPPARAGTR
jgi:hypothetical protein